MHQFPGPIVEAFPTYLAEAILEADFPCAWRSMRGEHGILRVHGHAALPWHAPRAQLGSKVLGLLAQCELPLCKIRRGCRHQDKVSHLPAAPAGPPLQAGPNSEVEGKCAFTSITRALSNCIRLGSACQSVSVYANGERGCLAACLQAAVGQGPLRGGAKGRCAAAHSKALPAHPAPCRRRHQQLLTRAPGGPQERGAHQRQCLHVPGRIYHCRHRACQVAGKAARGGDLS